MIRLIRVELSRYAARRAIAILLLGAVVIVGLIAFGEAWNSRPISAEDRAEAQVEIDRMRDSPDTQQAIADCESDPTSFGGPDTTTADCAAMMVPRVEDYLYRSPIDLGLILQGAGIGVVVVLCALLMIGATTFAGADWASGSMSNQLLFEPRRTRIWLAKAVAVGGWSALVAAVVLSAFWLVLYLISVSRGIDVLAAVQTDIRWTVLRAVVLGAAAGVGGYALTMLLRHTVGTLAALFAYSVGGEIVLQLLSSTRSAQLSVINNVTAWLQGGLRVFVYDENCFGQESCEQRVFISMGDSAVFLGGILLVVSLTSWWSYRRRDVP